MTNKSASCTPPCEKGFDCPYRNIFEEDIEDIQGCVERTVEHKVCLWPKTTKNVDKTYPETHHHRCMLMKMRETIHELDDFLKKEGIEL